MQLLAGVISQTADQLSGSLKVTVLHNHGNGSRVHQRSKFGSRVVNLCLVLDPDLVLCVVA